MRAVTIHAAHIGYAHRALDCPRCSATLNLIEQFVRPLHRQAGTRGR